MTLEKLGDDVGDSIGMSPSWLTSGVGCVSFTANQTNKEGVCACQGKASYVNVIPSQALAGPPGEALPSGLG